MVETIQWHEVFLKRILIIGCILVFLIPPIQAADENVHFLNAYAFMKGDFYPEFEPGTQMGRSFPKDMIAYVEWWNADEDGKTNLEDVMNYSESVAGEGTENIFLPYWASETNLIGYIFSGGGMLACSLLYRLLSINVSGYELLIAGRMFNLLFYATVIYWAIKMTPYYKKTLLALALMPMAIFQASTLSYDAILIPCCFLLFAIIMRKISEDTLITPGLFATMCFISIIVFNVKTVYAPFLFGLAFIPNERFGGKKKYIVAGCVIVGCGLGSFAINKLVLSISTSGFQNPYGELYTEQIQYLLGNPLTFINYILNSFRHYRGFYFSGFIGLMGKRYFALPSFIIIYYGLFLVMIAFVESACGNIIKRWNRIALGIMLGLSVYISFAGIYVTWTAIKQGIGGNWVDGIQGRYFIPIAIFVPMIFSHKKSKKQNGHSFNICDNVVFYTVTIVPILLLFFALLRFWNI